MQCELSNNNIGLKGLVFVNFNSVKQSRNFTLFSEMDKSLPEMDRCHCLSLPTFIHKKL